ncbi:MAG: hypothetical protein JNK58_09110 [Phycisphaerae bacterium]|nr:hypothetical protein [Phycisphaerae bacterium]
MEFITALWMPIVLSAVAVWIASALGWMVVGHHKKDWIGLPNEDAFTSAVRALNLPPGNYGFPHAEDCHKAMKDPEFQNKWKNGPVGLVQIWKPDGSMAKPMLLTFIVYLVTGVLIAYLGWNAFRGESPSFAAAFRVLGTAGILAYTISHIPSGIWFQSYPRAILMCIIDGVIYGLITGAIFAAMWPAGH